MSGFFNRLPTRLGRKQAPIWLWAYAVAVVVERVLYLVFRPGPLFLVPFLLISLLVVWLVLRGGRVAWCWAVAVEAVGVAGLAWGEPLWSVALSSVLLAFLLTPSSRAYVWREAVVRRQTVSAREGWGARISSGALWEEIWSWIGSRALDWKFIVRLGLVVVVLMPVEGILRGARDDGWAMAALFRAASISAGLALILLVILLIAMGVRALARLIQPQPKEEPPA